MVGPPGLFTYRMFIEFLPALSVVLFSTAIFTYIITSGILKVKRTPKEKERHVLVSRKNR